MRLSTWGAVIAAFGLGLELGMHAAPWLAVGNAIVLVVNMFVMTWGKR